MRICNIQNTRRFFERLSECEGDIEIENEEGMHLSLFDDDQKNPVESERFNHYADDFTVL